ncbi:hypothetical protein C4552_00210 [Candidatus Parcubacteria bacterium]|nr:MAG: hypothetical protein C4552_00210 [Candidatus Parcubacteria bacterium]
MNLPTFTWRQIWVTGLLAIIASFTMWKGGLTTAFWTTLGIFGLAVLMGLAGMVGGVGGRIAAIALMIWAIMSVVYPAVGAAFRAEWPMLSWALHNSKAIKDMELADWVNPSASRARLGLADHCNKMEDLRGEYVENVLLERYNETRRRAIPEKPGYWASWAIWLGWREAPKPVFPMPQRFADMKLGFKLERVKKPEVRDGKGNLVSAVVTEQYEASIADVVMIIENEREECRALYARAGKPELPDRDKNGKSLESLTKHFSDDPRQWLRDVFVGPWAVWSFALLIIAGLLLGLVTRRVSFSIAFGYIIITLIMAAAIDWAASEEREWFKGKAYGAVTTRHELPQKRGGRPDVPGSYSYERSVPPTLITREDDALIVRIDGSLRHGHVVAKLEPGQTAVVTYLGGMIAYNSHGDRFLPCGRDHRRLQQWEVFPYSPELRPFAIGVYLDPPGLGSMSDPTQLPCGKEPLRIKNAGTVPAKLVFIYNTAMQYREVLDGKVRTDGYTYAGWDCAVDPEKNCARFKIVVKESS